MASCRTKKNVFVCNTRTLFLSQNKDMFYCSAQRHVFLRNKKTSGLMQQDNMTSCWTGRRYLCPGTFPLLTNFYETNCTQKQASTVRHATNGELNLSLHRILMESPCQNGLTFDALVTVSIMCAHSWKHNRNITGSKSSPHYIKVDTQVSEKMNWLAMPFDSLTHPNREWQTRNHQNSNTRQHTP